MNNFHGGIILDPNDTKVQRISGDYTTADKKYAILKREIQEFQENLSDDLDVCVELASFGTSIVMQVIDIGYQNPDILYFWGYVNGNKAQLIQHISQLNFLLMAVPTENPHEEPRRIGFVVEDDDDEKTAEAAE